MTPAKENREKRLIIADACIGLVEAVAELFPQAQWQRCVVHCYRNVFSQVPTGKVAEVARMPKAIHAQEERRSAEAKAKEVVKSSRRCGSRNPSSLARRRPPRR